jgi:hypothetical protein
VDVIAAMLIRLTLNLVQEYLHKAEEHVSANNRQLSRHSGGTMLGKKYDELRQGRAEMLSASDSDHCSVLGHDRCRLHSAGAQLNYVR